MTDEPPLEVERYGVHGVDRMSDFFELDSRDPDVRDRALVDYKAHAHIRPLERSASSLEVRLFDGRWFDPRSLPDAILSTRFEYVAQLRTTYLDLVAQAVRDGDDAAFAQCRELAQAIYRWMDVRERADDILVAALAEAKDGTMLLSSGTGTVSSGRVDELLGHLQAALHGDALAVDLGAKP